MIRRFCAYGVDFRNSDSFNHSLYNLIPALELKYRKSINSSTGKTPAIMEKCWNPRLPYETLKKDLDDMYSTARIFNIILDKKRHNTNRCMQDYFKYARERWEKRHKPPDLRIGNLVLVSSLNFNSIKGPKKLKDSFAGPFMMRELHVPNSVQLDLTG
ncbi:hypothetical protein O181_070259 [Austropuccinia psidii MF-1]|uniref:Uncharacterized protein n=1 Tax=Austropuccinia psidii MF-1 TaxID=1389203 RepID=A0A9Q3I9B2_9BASI|nr:hypothetical protein [Austropuccinia psidii MF-1]